MRPASALRPPLRRAALAAAALVLALLGSLLAVPVAASAASPGSIGGTATAGGSAYADQIEAIVYNTAGGIAGRAPVVNGGAYTVGGLAAGDYTVQFVPNNSGYLPHSTEWWSEGATRADARVLTLADGETRTGVDTVLDPITYLVGYVRAANGDGIDGASATACQDDDCRTATSDYEGRFVLDQIEAGPQVLEITAPAGSVYLSPAVQTVTVPTPSNEYRVTLAAGPSISGTVIGADGQTADEVTVEIYAAGDTSTPVASVSAPWYTDGRFASGLLPAGDYRIRFVDNAGGYVSEWWRDATTAAASTVVTLGSVPVADIAAVLAPANSISGLVTASDTGLPLEGGDVVAFSGPAFGTVAYFGTVDADGRYLIKGMEPGSYKLLFRPSDSDPTYSPEYHPNADTLALGTAVVLAAGEAKNVDAQLDRAGSISGRVTDAAGQPIANLEVWAWAQTAGSSGFATTDADGRYTIYTIAGRYKLNFRPESKCNLYAAEWYPDRATQTTAGVSTIVLANRALLSGYDAVLADGLCAPFPTVTAQGEAAISAPKVGDTVIADPGVWQPEGVTFTYQWVRRSSASGVDSDIPGATGADYSFTSADINRQVSVAVTGSKPGYSSAVRASSVLNAVVGTGTLSPVPPTITGTVAVGSTLTAVVGAWAPAADTYTYTWRREGSAASIGSLSTYTPGAADLGKTLTVTVTGTRAGFPTATATSTPTAAVSPGIFTTTRVPTVTGSTVVGQTLTAASAAWAPAVVALAYSWYRGSETERGTAIPGAAATTYRLTAADAGFYVRSVVTGTKANYTTVTTQSLPRTMVTGGVLAAPTPTLSGTAVVGEQLTIDAGTWAAGTTLEYTFSHEDGRGTVQTGTSSQYTLSNADAGQRLFVVVTGSRPGYTTVSSQASASTATVTGGVLTAPTPTLSGDAFVGLSITADSGDWTAGTTLHYAFTRSDGVVLQAGPSASYTLLNGDAGHSVTVVVSGTRQWFDPRESEPSRATVMVTGGELASTMPAISGTAVVGRSITAVPGAWTAGAALDYAFTRSDGTVVQSGEEAAYLLTNDDAGATLTVAVTGTLAGYATKTSRPSDATLPVTGGTQHAVTPRISGIAVVGQTLSASAPGWAPAAALVSYTWYADGAAVQAGPFELLLTDALAGRRLTVVADGTAVGFDPLASVSSDATAIVTGGTLSFPVPLVGGSTTVGSTLDAGFGPWAPDGTVFSYAWHRDGGGDTVGTAAAYTLGNADAGSTLSVTVTGTRAGFVDATLTSAATAPVTGGSFTRGVPTITGSQAVGSTLAAHPGVWSPAPTSYGYEWNRAGASAPVGIGETYQLTAADAGGIVTVTVTAARSGFDPLAATSAATSAVDPGRFALAPDPVISGAAEVGSVLTAVTGEWSPAADLAIEWFAGDEPVAVGSEYAPTNAVAGLPITVAVTGSAPGYTPVTTVSAATTIVTGGEFVPGVPVITAPATVAVGSTLTASEGVWTPEPDSVSYQWTRDGVPIAPTATAVLAIAAVQDGAVYTVAEADAGRSIGVIVTVRRSGFDDATATAASEVRVAALQVVVPTEPAAVAPAAADNLAATGAGTALVSLLGGALALAAGALLLVGRRRARVR